MNFRASLIRSLVSDGHTLTLAAPADPNVTDLLSLGAKFIPIEISAHGKNPLTELFLLLKYILLLRRERPEIVLCYTAKPNIYGSIAARILDIPVINNISGLGSAFISGGWLTQILQLLYRFALNRSKCVFFQNPDDLKLFLSLKIINKPRSALLPGSGVDLNKFQQQPLPCLQLTADKSRDKTRKFVFLLIARVIKDKGIGEYVQAARILKKNYSQITCAVLGFIDEKNPNSIEPTQLKSWLDEGIVSYWGISRDVRLELRKADCVVLPSYREGTPRTLLEAASMGRPLIATDVPGCREVVIDNINGLLCLPKDANDLAKKMEQMLSMPDSQLQQMSEASRLLAEVRFDEQLVIGKYRTVLIDLLVSR